MLGFAALQECEFKMSISGSDILGWKLPRCALGERGGCKRQQEDPHQASCRGEVGPRGGQRATLTPRAAAPSALRGDAPRPAQRAQKSSAQLAEHHRSDSFNLPLRFMGVEIEKSQFLKFAKD